jgi:hypothetical protein
MAKTFNWVVSKAEAIQQLGGLTNVVSDIHYRRVITDENGNTTDIFDVAKIPTPAEGEEFIPADQLTFEDYCFMLEKHLDVQRIDKILTEKFKDLFPQIVKVDLPLSWAVVDPQPEPELKQDTDTIDPEPEAEWVRPWEAVDPDPEANPDPEVQA